MKKISFYLTILFRKTINEKIDATQLAQEVFNLIESKDPLRTLEIAEAFEKICKSEMMKRKSEAEKVCRAVNAKWVSEPVQLERKPYVYDKNYDRPLEELETIYSIAN